MTTETRPESQQFPPLLTKEQYLAALSETDRKNVNFVLSVLQNTPILEPLFETKKAGVFAVGSTAIPRELLGREPNDINLRLVVNEEINFHTFFLLMREMYNGTPNFLNLEFKYKSFDPLIDEPVAEFNPKEGNKIDVLLPLFELDYNDQVEEFLENISKPSWEFLQSIAKSYGKAPEDILKFVYVVQLL